MTRAILFSDWFSAYTLSNKKNKKQAYHSTPQIVPLNSNSFKVGTFHFVKNVNFFLILKNLVGGTSWKEEEKKKTVEENEEKKRKARRL